MMEQEHRICYGGSEATPKSLKRVKPYQAPLRGLGIAELEKLRSEESQKRFFPGTELVLHPLYPQPNTTVPFITGFDSGSPFGYHVENFPMFWSQLLDLSPLVSSDGTMPLLWSSFQSDTSSSSNSQLSFVTSELKQPPREAKLLSPLQKHEPQQQISQVMNHSSLHSVPGAGLQMELKLPSNQSHCGIVDASSWAVQQIKMPQKRTTESGESKASDTSSALLAFYNFMELPDSAYVAERDVIAAQNRRGWEGFYAVDVDLKL